MSPDLKAKFLLLSAFWENADKEKWNMDLHVADEINDHFAVLTQLFGRNDENVLTIKYHQLLRLIDKAKNKWAPFLHLYLFNSSCLGMDSP